MVSSSSTQEQYNAGQKRPRIDTELVRDTDIWMSDGNIIVAADHCTEEDRTRYVFKCHKSVLCRHSEVFDGLFEVAYASPADQYEGLPLVHFPDPYEDVKGLLRLLYDLSAVPQLRQAPVAQWEEELATIEGALRLAAKYDLQVFHSRLATVFYSRWPATLREWDDREVLILNASLNWFQDVPHPARIIRLSHDARLSEALPAAFYDLHRRWRSRHTFNEPHSDVKPPTAAAFDAQLNLLLENDTRRLIEGREWLHAAVEALYIDGIPGAIERMPTCNEPARGNSGLTNCRRMAKKVWDRLVHVEMQTGQFFFGSLGSIRVYRNQVWRNGVGHPYGMCMSAVFKPYNEGNSC